MKRSPEQTGGSKQSSREVIEVCELLGIRQNLVDLLDENGQDFTLMNDFGEMEDAYESSYGRGVYVKFFREIPRFRYERDSTVLIFQPQTTREYNSDPLIVLYNRWEEWNSLLYKFKSNLLILGENFTVGSLKDKQYGIDDLTRDAIEDGEMGPFIDFKSTSGSDIYIKSIMPFINQAMSYGGVNAEEFKTVRSLETIQSYLHLFKYGTINGR